METSTLISSPSGLVQAEFGPAESVLSTMGQRSHASNFRLDLSPVILWEAREERELSPISLVIWPEVLYPRKLQYKHSSCVTQMCDPWMRSQKTPCVRVSVLVTIAAHSGALPLSNSW